ncbi:MAG: EAL domain-containing protein [Candidatus Doudnabacteria bacterium]|nr:EAL domain-containing protein [Candidatus Doudnabacteria bacterium]
MLKRILILAIIYFLTARLGLSLAQSTEQVTAIWAPSGIALAGLLIFGYRIWPGILIGAFAANVMAREPFLTAVGIAVSNTAVGLAGAYLLKEKLGFKNGLGRVRDVIAFVVAGAFLSSLIGSILGTLNLAISQIIAWEQFARIWLVWWLGDMAGILLVAPLILVWANRESRNFLASKLWEARLFFLLLLMTAGIIFLRIPETISPYAYLMLPFIVWAGLRLRPIGAVTANFVIATIAVIGTFAHRGPFTGNDSLEVNLILLLVYFFVFSMTSLIMAASIEEGEEAQTQAQHRIYYDSLTDLPNRFYFFEHMSKLLTESKIKQSYALLNIDLDRFKTINDSLGHILAEDLLKFVAARIRSVIDIGSFMARSGGDEFAVLVNETSERQNALNTAEDILESLKKPFVIDGYELHVTASIGISSFPNDAADASSLLNTAKAALHRAKGLGRNNFQFYTESLASTTFQQLTMENALRRSIQNREMLVYFEPQIELSGGKIIKNEALLRWQHPTMGLVRPSEFIELAEVTGMIDEIGDYALEKAIAQTAEWHKSGLPVGVAVNLSSRQFNQTDLGQKISGWLQKYRLPSKLLELELTERTLLAEADLVRRIMEELGRIGVNFTIDDFNTGYSSLSYVKQFNIDVLKIDRSFVAGIPNNAHDRAIAITIIQLAHNLGKVAVAEGVENKRQLEFLIKNHCDRAQGYLFSPPLPADSCFEFMASKSIWVKEMVTAI